MDKVTIETQGKRLKVKVNGNLLSNVSGFIAVGNSDGPADVTLMMKADVMLHSSEAHVEEDFTLPRSPPPHLSAITEQTEEIKVTERLL